MNSINRITKYFSIIIFGFAALTFAGENTQDDVAPSNNFANIVYSDFGINHSMLTLGLGYGRYLPIDAIDRHLLVFVDYALPIASFDIRNFRVQSGARINAIQMSSFQVPVWLSLNASGAHNKIFRATGLGSELGIAPGYYGRTFVLASELYWNQTWAAYIKHTQTYRDQFYENAKDGWYSMAATSFRAGLNVAWHVHKRFTVGLKGGYQHMGQYNKLIPPIFFTLNTQFNF